MSKTKKKQKKSPKGKAMPSQAQKAKKPTKTKAAKKSPKASKAKAQKTKPSAKSKGVKAKLSPQEEKMEIVEAYLNEVYHLICHSIDQGTEAENPWFEIMTAMLSVHNDLEMSEGHKYHGVKFLCECPAQEHQIDAKTYIHDCE